MPTYQYACTECGHRLEAVQSFTDDPLSICPECTGRLRKVFSAVGVVFKGSGFYLTDSRAANAANAAKETVGSKSESKSESDGSKTPEKKSDAKSSDKKSGSGSEQVAKAS